MKIEDNFLKQGDFNRLQAFMMNTGSGTFEGDGLAWFYNGIIDFKEDVDKFQFVHVFYTNSRPIDDSIQILTPILKILKPIALWRIKANLLTRTSKIVENEFHRDQSGVLEEKLKQWTTSIFYVNTNNGYTEFEDGTIVESVRNRLVLFPCNLKHRSTTTTDTRHRLNVNINYD